MRDSQYYIRGFHRMGGDEYFLAYALGIPKYFIDIPLGLFFVTAFIVEVWLLGDWRTRIKWLGPIFLGSIHHLENDQCKKEFYKKIYDILPDSGLFINADVVLASTNYNQIINMIRWIEYMNKNVHQDEIFSNWIPKYKAEDRPARLMDQLRWLEDIGFKSVDVFWKYYNFSVYGAIK